MKELKDYIQHYIPCKAVTVVGTIETVDVLGYSTDGEMVEVLQSHSDMRDWWNLSAIKPILRPHATSEDTALLPDASCSITPQDVYYTPEAVRILCSRGVDLFGLIDANLAITPEQVNKSMQA